LENPPFLDCSALIYWGRLYVKDNSHPVWFQRKYYFLDGEGKIFMPDTPIRSVILDSLVALNHTTKVDLEKQASQI
jgi:hypothetical protein